MPSHSTSTHSQPTTPQVPPHRQHQHQRTASSSSSHSQKKQQSQSQSQPQSQSQSQSQQQQQQQQTPSTTTSRSQSKRRVPREVRFGAYVLGSTLGEGEFGKVKLGWRKDGKHPSQAAIKLIRRDSIPRGSEKESKIHREINALKKLSHPNIVRLEEVLQNDKYIGIVLEYASGGELFDYILEHKYLKESLASRLFAQLVSGVDYMHNKGIVHRDLKLENLLLDKHKNIVITDFGFVNSFAGHDLMRTSCGSPCYAAPELVVSSEPYEGRKVDVWSCGVILYAMLAGYLPFDDDPQNPDGDNIARLYHYITHTPLTFPEYIQPTPRDLLRKILVSNPRRRINLKQVRSHPWLSPHAPFLSVTPIEWDKNYKSSMAMNPQVDKASRRLSLMENPTSASFMFNRPNIKSYSTHNVSNLLYSHPAAPQTSRAVALPSASSSDLNSPTSPVRNNNITSTTSRSKSPAAVSSSASPINAAAHKRSDSSASLAALQAVVEADNVELNRRSTTTATVPASSPATTATTTSAEGTTTISSSSTGKLIPSFIPHSYTFDGVTSSSLSSFTTNSNTNNKNGFETIDESPEKSRTEMLPPLLAPFNKNGAAAVASHASNTAKLPARVNKPRPTSYHPGTTTSSNYQYTTPDFNFLMPLNNSDTSLTALNPRPRFDRSNSQKASATAITTPTSASASPKKENRNSWGQSKVIEPTLDMSKANGVLAPPTGPQHKSSSSTSNSEKRKSAAFDSLSNAIDMLSISSKSTVVANKDSTTGGSNGQLVGTAANATSPNGIQRDVSRNSAMSQQADKETLASVAPSPPTDNTSASDDETVEGSNSKDASQTIVVRSGETNKQPVPVSPPPAMAMSPVESSPMPKINKLALSEAVKTTSHQPTHHIEVKKNVSRVRTNSTNDNNSHTSNPKRNSISISRKVSKRVSSKSSEKENRVSESTNATPVKFKRFSLLSFYHSSNPSSPTTPTSAAADEENNTPSSNQQHSRKPLENSNRRISLNLSSHHRSNTTSDIKDVIPPATSQVDRTPSQSHRHGSRNVSNAYKRMSLPNPIANGSTPGSNSNVAANGNGNGSNTTYNKKEKEGGAAKRVMDFFKRRSIRI
ncbi:unnamed protein product [Ambrosiozyma monospora]|uniref:non-specific serine/threonine protein kinase n=1 Tax=Ambrosiozyma monospora TaxID=43982 RepID=A0A9W6YX72_AMBMO|nr:unnamed protein product [Ambrosiozyma monospora]